MTLAQKRDFFWNPPLMEKIEILKGGQFEQFLNASIPDVNDPIKGVWPFPSILCFKVSSELIAGGNQPVLSCKVIGGHLEDDDINTLLLLYISTAFGVSAQQIISRGGGLGLPRTEQGVCPVHGEQGTRRPVNGDFSSQRRSGNSCRATIMWRVRQT